MPKPCAGTGRPAEPGHADAQFKLGVAFANGRVVKRDHTEAVRWYRKAAKQGDVGGQCNPGVAFANGRGVKQDHAEAVHWFRKAAEQGQAGAHYYLGNMY